MTPLERSRVFVDNQILTRQVNPAGGYLSQSSQTLHFGLGKKECITRVEITWPSGIVQRLDPPKINAVHQIVEPAESK